MKKSKFLKKSLAMLLAVMLVVAMIPLSAAAAGSNLPDLASLVINGSTVAVDGTTFKADIDEDADNVRLAAYVEENATLTVARTDGSIKSGTISDTAVPFKFEEYGTESNGVVTLKLTLTSEDGSNSKDFTVELTRKEKSDLTNLESVKPGAQVLAATFDNNAKTVTVTVPFGYSNGGSIEIKTANDAIVTDTTISNIDADGDTFDVTSASGDVTTPWTIKVVKVAPLTAFAIDGTAAEITDETKDGEVDTIKVTLDPKQIQNDFEEPETNPELPVTFSVLADTTVTWNVNATDGNLKSGESYALTGLTSTAPITGKNVTVTCKGVVKTYDLTIEVAESSDKEISYARLNNKVATINGNTITAVLPASSDLESVALVLRTATTAEVTAVSTPVITDTETVSDGDNTDDYNEFTATVDLTKGATVTVTAQDGTTKQYTVSATKSSQATDAKLDDVTLKNGDTNYEGSISGNVVTFTVPYMTKDMSGWKLFVTPNGEATAYKANGTDVLVSGSSTAADLGAETASIGTETVTIKDAIIVKNDNNPAITAKYTVVIKLETAKTGKTLSTLNTTATELDTNDQAIVRDIKDSNTFKATINGTDKTVKITVAYSLGAAEVYPIEFTTAPGGVAFVGTKSGDNYEAVSRLTALNGDEKTDVKASPLKGTDKYIIVLPEEIAKGISNEITKPDAAYGTAYQLKIETAAASSKAVLSALKVKDTTLSVGGQKITGTVPYGLTVADNEVLTEKNTYFLDYTISDYATLTDGTNTFNVNGIPAGEEKAANASDKNAKIAFVRTADNKVVVNIWDGTEGATADVDSPVAELTVKAEDQKGTGVWSFNNMKHANANTGAEITSFRVANVNGSISGRTITVNVPFGTDLMGLVPTFTTSTGAEVTTAAGSEVISGETVMNFSNDVTLMVTAEDGNNTVAYTVKVTAADQFSDVDTTDWYYNNVMRAVELGILSGYTDGTFKPMNNITRRDFAIMLAQSLGHDNDEKATSPFKDVADTDYGVSSIAYLYENEITVGDSNGNFNPDANITRQEAAIMLVKAFEATGTSSDLYADDAQIASWAKSFVYTAKAAGLMKGDDHNEFNPTDRLTRAEAASAMVNAVDN